MLGAVILNIAFPILMNRVATSPSGWSKLMGMFAIPGALIGILRFVFVKEEIEVFEEHEQKTSIKDVGIVLRKNPYVYMVAFMQFAYSMVTGMGILAYFYTYIYGDIEFMGIANAFAIVAVPLLFIFPALLKKIPKGKLVQLGSIIYIISGILYFIAGSRTSIVIAAVIFTGIATLPMTYLTDLLMLDCGSFNAWKGYKRMDGVIGAIKGFVNKLGGAIGSGLMGILLGLSGYDGNLAVQPEGAMNMIRFLMGGVPAVMFLLVAIVMIFYKLDRLMPEINKVIESKSESME